MPKVISSLDNRIPIGSQLLKINNHHIEDFLDYQFYNDSSKTRQILLQIDGIIKSIALKSQEKIDIKLEEPRYRHCENDCYFCFIKGLPKDLRKELYFRDDDYRLSFLFGNFLSLTNLHDHHIRRIARLRLSPLYISVHTTNRTLRQRIFKNKKAGMIMDQLSTLVELNIKLHCQIVLIPGINDGKELIETIYDLAKLYPGVESIGIVPVGKTRYLKGIASVSRNLARETIKAVTKIHLEFRKKYNKGIVYLADEFYIKAGLSIPKSSYYDDFPQYENGIGMTRQFIDEISSIRGIKKLKKGRFLMLTGELAFSFVDLLKGHLSNSKIIEIDVVVVKNFLFGNYVTVSGLIGGNDFQRVINSIDKKYDRIILPPNCVNDAGRFIDNVELDDKRIIVAPYRIKEFLKCLQ